MGAEHPYLIVSRRGVAYVEDQTFDLEPDVWLFIPESRNHRLDVIGNETMWFVVLMAPPPRLGVAKDEGKKVGDSGLHSNNILPLAGNQV